MRQGHQFSPPSVDRNALARLQSNLDEEEREEEDREEEFQEPEDEGPGASIELPTAEELAIERTASAKPAFDPPPGYEVAPERERTVEEILADAENAEEYDIFLDVGEPLAAKGDHVSYSIKRSGRQVTMAEHPYSYEQLQKEYGGGAYVVSLRSTMFSKKKGGGFIKTQSRALEEPKGSQAAQEKQSNSIAEMLTMMQQAQDKARAEQQAEIARLREESRAREERLEREARLREERMEREAKEREAREREREEKRKGEGSETMMMFLKMMEQSNQQAQAAAQRQSELLLTLLTKAPPEPKEDKRNEKMFDMLLGMLVDKKSKGDALDPIALQKLLSDAEEKGYSRAKEIRDLANEEAERLAARLGTGGDEDDDEEKEEKEETPTQTLLKTITPLIAQMAAAPSPPPQVPARAALPRPPMRPPTPPRRPVNPNIPAVAPGQVARPPQGPQPGSQPQQTAPQPPRSSAQSMGLPRAVPQAPRAPQPAPQASAQPKGAPVSDKPFVSAKEIVSEVVVNLIGVDLGANLLTPSKLDPEGVADKALASPSLKDIKVDAAWLLKNFTLDDMKGVAKKKGIPDAIHPYLERFYARVKARETTDQITVDRAAQSAPQAAPEAAPAGGATTG